MKKTHDNTYKKCPLCGRILPHSWFNASGNGKQSYCKDCQAAYKRKHPHVEYKYKKKGDGQLRLAL